jgi:hypothetical protein
MLVNEAREGYREPTRQLTWLSASPAMPFVEQVLAHCAMSVACAVLRSRALGYCRLLTSLLASKTPFDAYVRCEMSGACVPRLGDHFADDPRQPFEDDEGELLSANGPFDVAISPLTVNHLIRRWRSRRGADPLTPRESYIRWYTQPEMSELVDRCGFHKAVGRLRSPGAYFSPTACDPASNEPEAGSASQVEETGLPAPE